jgi:hypothetical protein
MLSAKQFKKAISMNEIEVQNKIRERNDIKFLLESIDSEYFRDKLNMINEELKMYGANKLMNDILN